MQKLINVLVLIACVSAHSYLSSIVIDGVDQGERNCLRPLYGGPVDPLYGNAPINDVKVLTNGLLSQNMTCGFLPYADTAANRKCTVAAGTRMAMIWHHNNNQASDDIIADSHKGPCLVYMAKSDTGRGTVWFKIAEEGYNTATKEWCATRLRNTQGKWEFTLPTDISPGNYLLRMELIALHDGTQMYGSQPYVSCAELTVTGSGTVNPGSDFLVSFPGAYSHTDAGILYNVYQNPQPAYPIPGPKVYKSGAAPTNQQTSNQQTSTPATSGGNNNNGCANIIDQCKTLCGDKGFDTCQCANGNPTIKCNPAAETSAASSLRPFWF